MIRKSGNRFSEKICTTNLAQAMRYAACGVPTELAFASRPKAATCHFGTGNAAREHRPHSHYCQRFFGVSERRRRPGAGGFSRAHDCDAGTSAADSDAPPRRAGASHCGLWRDRAARGCSRPGSLTLAVESPRRAASLHRPLGVDLDLPLRTADADDEARQHIDQRDHG